MIINRENPAYSIYHRMFKDSLIGGIDKHRGQYYELVGVDYTNQNPAYHIEDITTDRGEIRRKYNRLTELGAYSVISKEEHSEDCLCNECYPDKEDYMYQERSD